jgi:hypothetical protein
MLVTVNVCPQSVQTSFMPATVFSRTSWTVFEWHLVHSLDSVSGLGMHHNTVNRQNLTFKTAGATMK